MKPLMVSKIFESETPVETKELNHLKLLKFDKSPYEKMTDDYNLIVDESWNSFCQFTKRILASESDQNKSFIRFVDTFTDNDRLKKLRASLNKNEVIKWEKMIEQAHKAPFNVESVWGSFKLEIKKIKMSSSGDMELDMLITSLSTDMTQEFISKHPDLAPILVNYLNHTQTAKLFNAMSTDAVVEMMLKAETINFEEKKSEFKIKLGKFFSNSQNQFLLTIGDISSRLNESKKMIVLKNILNLGNVELTRQLALEVLPSETFVYIDATYMKEILSDIDIKRKVEFLASVKDEEREDWLSSMAEKESKAMDVLQMELEQILGNEDSLKKFRSQADFFKTEFYNQVRGKLSGQRYVALREDIVDQWIESYSKPARKA